MKIVLDIPDDYSEVYTKDKFNDFFLKVSKDVDMNSVCGPYQKKMADIFLAAFDNSKELSGMDTDRSKVIINNLLSEVTEKVWESGNKEYMAWLKNEVGLSDKELSELSDAGCLPLPEYESEMEM